MSRSLPLARATLIYIVLAGGCALKQQLGPSSSSAATEPAAQPQAADTTNGKVTGLYIGTPSNWSLQFFPDGGGQVGHGSIGDIMPPGRFLLDDVTRRLEPSLKDTRADAGEYTVYVHQDGAWVTYYTADSKTIGDLFDSAQHSLAARSADAKNPATRKAPVLDSDADWGRRMAQPTNARTFGIRLRTPDGQWLDIHYDGAVQFGRDGMSAYLPPGRFLLDDILRRLGPSLQTERAGDAVYTVNVYRDGTWRRYYTPDRDAVQNLFETIRPSLSAGDTEHWEKTPPTTRKN